jgi:dipeptidyl aminopeptidase/acylaminoacyl peptidase
VAYASAGLTIFGWIVTPTGPGPWPLFVFNHGSNVGADLVDHSADPAWRPAFACYNYLTDNHWLVFLPEGRGYGGSEGPGMGPVLRRELPVMQLLRGRADDVNAGVAQVERQANVRPNCTVIAGASHGGVVTLLAAGEAPQYQGVIAQSTGASYYSTTSGLSEMFDALDHISAPVLLQHAANDSLVPIAVSAQLAVHAQAAGKAVRFRQYPGLPGVEGHGLMQPRYSSIWKPDLVQFLGEVLAACP